MPPNNGRLREKCLVCTITHSHGIMNHDSWCLDQDDTCRRCSLSTNGRQDHANLADYMPANSSRFSVTFKVQAKAGKGFQQRQAKDTSKVFKTSSRSNAFYRRQKPFFIRNSLLNNARHSMSAFNGFNVYLRWLQCSVDSSILCRLNAEQCSVNIQFECRPQETRPVSLTGKCF